MSTPTMERSRVFELAALAGADPRAFHPGIATADADRLLAAVLTDDATALAAAREGVIVKMRFGRRALSDTDIATLRAIVRVARGALFQAEAEIAAATARRDRLRALLGGES